MRRLPGLLAAAAVSAAGPQLAAARLASPSPGAGTTAASAGGSVSLKLGRFDVAPPAPVDDPAPSPTPRRAPRPAPSPAPAPVDDPTPSASLSLSHHHAGASLKDAQDAKFCDHAIGAAWWAHEAARCSSGASQALNRARDASERCLKSSLREKYSASFGELLRER